MARLCHCKHLAKLAEASNTAKIRSSQEVKGPGIACFKHTNNKEQLMMQVVACRAL